MTNASRAQVDLDAFARDLRHDDAASQASGKPDPLAELARIVGQDDPFRALLAAREESLSAREAKQPAIDESDFGRVASQFGGERGGWGSNRIEPRFSAEEPVRTTPADAFDQYLASVERDMHAAEPAAPESDADAADDVYDDVRSLRRVSPRRRLLSVGAGLAVVAVAVTGALTYRGMQGHSDGSVPVVQADTTPLKVAPKVADGVEIPDQNRQIYDRNATNKDSGQIKIVNREEQPLDVAEAARAAGGTPASAASANQGTTPSNGSFDAFGEPRRVRTVSVKPEAPPAPPPAPVAAAAPAESVPAVIPTMVLPSGDTPPPAPQPKAPKPVRQAEAKPFPAPAPAPAEPVAEARPPKPVPAAPKKAPQRVASVGIDTGVPETTQATSAPIDTTSAVGGFSVQLGVRNSAADARSAFRQIQAKYSELAGKPELIRQAEVNGKTIFRVRVGPLSKDEAGSLCSALQGQGGQCFVAKN